MIVCDSCYLLHLIVSIPIACAIAYLAWWYSVVSLMLVLTFLWLVVGPLRDSYAVFCFLLFIIVLPALTHYVMIALPPTNMQYGIFGGYGDCCMAQLFVSSCKIPFGQATPDEESDKIKELEDCANVAISCCEGWSSVEVKGLRLYTVIHFVIEAHFCYAGVLCVCGMTL